MDRLLQVLDGVGPLAVAVSGGVDSMTLASFAHRRGPHAVEMLHAVSPAVPPAATDRVRALAAAEGWALSLIEAGEFEDPDYLKNPVNRCYFCKANLYERIRSATGRIIASGANLDDLGDYRPGLLAARERAVVHPFILAEMTKADVRALASALELEDLASLPAQPCLASRVETGIAIDPEDLAFIDRVETEIAAVAGRQATIRCRVTMAGIRLEVGAREAEDCAMLDAVMARLCASEGRTYLGLSPYVRGAMFIR